ncbi:MAG: twin-arginine translocase subunit TatC [Methylacidiphilales bacterium]|nr:twin-arginine translocase subunit TatC [Candidatus Methylacidiphilales bacterium]
MHELPSKPFLDHLEDLRWLLIKIGITLALTIALGFIFTPQILDLLYEPLRRAGHDPQKILRVLGVVDPFLIQMHASFLTGIILALPFTLYFIGEFLLPALLPSERRLLIPVFTTGALLFLCGVAFCYFILLPQALNFFISYSRQFGLTVEWTLENYLNFTVNLLIAFGLCFELPLIILLLHNLEIITHHQLRTHRRLAILLIVIAAACITPTTDFYTLTLLAAPMILLYETCLLITHWLEKKKSARSQLPINP